MCPTDNWRAQVSTDVLNLNWRAQYPMKRNHSYLAYTSTDLEFSKFSFFKQIFISFGGSKKRDCNVRIFEIKILSTKTSNRLFYDSLNIKKLLTYMCQKNFENNSYLWFDANLSSFSLAESPTRDQQITVNKQWSAHRQYRPTVFGWK